MNRFFRQFLKLFFLLTVGCTSYSDKTRLMRLSFDQEQYQTALNQLEEADINADRNRFLYFTEKATILSRMKEAEKSRKLLMEADRLVDDLYTKSISKTAASFVVNDSMQDYEGELFEKVGVNLMLALSFLETQDISKAGVEARRINNKLKQFASQIGDDNNSYKEDPFARYLAGMIFEALKDYDDAIIDYQAALKLYKNPLYQRFYFGPVPASLIEGLIRLARMKKRDDVLRNVETLCPEESKQLSSDATKSPQGQLVIIHEIGRIAPKVAKEFALLLGGQMVRFSFPFLPQIPPRKVFAGVDIKGQYYPSSEVINFNSLGHYVLEDRRLGLIAKGAVRLLAKAQLTENAYKNWGLLGGLAANIYGVVTETADTRSWTTLPASLSVTRVWLPPGKHQLVIRGSRGLPMEMSSVDIKADEIAFIRTY